MARLSAREMLWNKISRTCFQDRVMPYAYWFAAVTDQAHHEHQKILNQSISIFSGAEFVRLLGDQQFTDTWQSIRDDIDTQRSSTRQGAKPKPQQLTTMLVMPSASFRFSCTISARLLDSLRKALCARSQRTISRLLFPCTPSSSPMALFSIAATARDLARDLALGAVEADRDRGHGTTCTPRRDPGRVRDPGRDPGCATSCGPDCYCKCGKQFDCI